MARRALVGGLVLVFLLATTGCAIKMNVRTGQRPPTAALEQRLRIGQSGVDDVLAALGPPHGRGKAMLPIDERSRVTWSYIYTEGFVHMVMFGGTEMDSRTLMLFVFFQDDRYDGYLWFSSVKD